MGEGMGLHSCSPVSGRRPPCGLGRFCKKGALLDKRGAGISHVERCLCVWLAGVAAWLFQIRPAPPTCSMMKYLKKPDAPFANNVAAALNESVLAGTLHADLLAATAFVEQELQTRAGQLAPLGLAAPILTIDEIKEKMRKQEQIGSSSVQVLFSGSLAMLDLRERVEPMEDLDLAKMKFACQKLESPGEVNKLVETVHIVADVIDKELTGLRRADGDENIDALIWAIYQNPETTATVLEAAQNLVFSASRCGLGLDQKIERFRLMEQEEQKRNCMGKSAFKKSKILLDLVSVARTSRDGGVGLNLKDDALAESVLQKHKDLGSWKKDTCGKYLYVAERTSDKRFANLFQDWEYQKGRDALCDGITILRSACYATKTPDELFKLLETLYFEQTCRMRNSLKTKTGRSGAGDPTQVMRGLVLRQNFYNYVNISFDKLKDSIGHYGTWKYYNQRCGMTEGGHFKTEQVVNSDDENEDAEEEKQLEQVSIFACKKQLLGLLDAIAGNKYEATFSALAKELGPSCVLDFTTSSMKGLGATLQQIHHQYQIDFPAPQAPQVGLQNIGASTGAPMDSPVKISSVFETDEDYQRALAEYNKLCKQIETEQINEYMQAQIVPIICDLNSEKLVRKLASVKILQDSGRKLWLHDLLLSTPVNWAQVRAQHKSIRCDPDVAYDPSQRDTDSGDSLRPLKSVYTQFRNTMPDGSSDDVVGVVVPGEIRDKPVNDNLDKCYKSLRHLIPTHQDPKIGTIELTNAGDSVQNRNIFKRKLEHHFLFTYQNAADSNHTRKRMKLLSGGHTSVNSWPVQQTLLSQRLQITQEEHDKVFDGAVPGCATTEAGEEVNVEAISSQVVPFPFELSRVFVQEVIDVWGVKLAIFLEVGSGECLFGSILEHTKCVGIFKSAAHKKTVWTRLFDLVKNARLVNIKLPEKPVGITQWEAGRKSGTPTTKPPLPVTTPPVPAPPTPAVPHPVVGVFGGQAPPPQTQPAQVRPSTFAAFGASQLNAR